MATYPTIDREGVLNGWTERPQDDTVEFGAFVSGRPFSIQTRTFDPRSWDHEVAHFDDADMATLDAFYVTNKTLNFWWYNGDDSLYYDVMYDERPEIISGNDKNDWRIDQKITQFTSVTLGLGDYGYGVYGADKYGGAGS
jgi:hypothetical protein